MGEEKRRGNRDQRVAEAMTARQTPESVRVEMGLPESCQFHGYVVYLPDTDEFVAGTDGSSHGASMTAYGATPNLAKTWPTYRAAEQAAVPIKKHRTVVSYLFSSDSKWYLGFDHPDGISTYSEAATRA
jgi:hypothetical protein